MMFPHEVGEGGKALSPATKLNISSGSLGRGGLGLGLSSPTPSPGLPKLVNTRIDGHNHFIKSPVGKAGAGGP